MAENQKATKSEADAELEREIRNSRKFTLEEAIGRLAGPGAMKGASPIARKQQAEYEIESYIRNNLPDAGGGLRIVLNRCVKQSEILLEKYEQPLVALAAYCQHVLDSDYRLKELVREADAEWGRQLGERPYFEKEGSPPHPDDLYTFESVRGALTEFVKQLAAGEAY